VPSMAAGPGLLIYQEERVERHTHVDSQADLIVASKVKHQPCSATAIGATVVALVTKGMAKANTQVPSESLMSSERRCSRRKSAGSRR
jgi:hypothetical protein